MIFIRFSAKAFSWLKISRLYFYPLPLIVYTLGAAAGYGMYRIFDLRIYVLGYVFIFLVELCSVLTNEYFDFKTDAQNKNPAPFNDFTPVHRALPRIRIYPSSSQVLLPWNRRSLSGLYFQLIPDSLRLYVSDRTMERCFSLAHKPPAFFCYPSCHNSFWCTRFPGGPGSSKKNTRCNFWAAHGHYAF